MTTARFTLIAGAIALSLGAAAAPARAQGLDSKNSPYPAAAYSGFVAGAPVLPAHTPTSAAYRYSGPHAGGPADDLRRH